MLYKVTTPLLHSEKAPKKSQTKMASTKCFAYLFFFLCYIFFTQYGTYAVEVSHDGRAIKIDGKRRVLISGSIHYPRSTPQVSKLISIFTNNIFFCCLSIFH